MAAYVPDSGHVVWLNFDPKAGHEQAGLRPAVIVSPGVYNGKVGLAICCPITHKKKGYPFEVLLPDGFPIKGVILADQLKSLDWRVRQAQYITSLPQEVFQEVKILPTIGNVSTSIQG